MGTSECFLITQVFLKEINIKPNCASRIVFRFIPADTQMVVFYGYGERNFYQYRTGQVNAGDFAVELSDHVDFPPRNSLPWSVDQWRGQDTLTNVPH